jgi:hypothetical protein
MGNVLRYVKAWCKALYQTTAETDNSDLAFMATVLLSVIVIGVIGTHLLANILIKLFIHE